MLGEVTHLQSILEDLCNLTTDPSALPPASEQVIFSAFIQPAPTALVQCTDTVTLSLNPPPLFLFAGYS